MVEATRQQLVTGFFVSIGVLLTIVIGVPIINPILESLLGFTIPIRLDIIAYTAVSVLLVFLTLRFVTLNRPISGGDLIINFGIPLVLLLVAYPVIFNFVPSELLSVVQPAFDYSAQASKEAMQGVMNLVSG